LAILGELFGIFQPSERFGLNSLPNKSPNFAKQCTKSHVETANSRIYRDFLIKPRRFNSSSSPCGSLPFSASRAIACVRFCVGNTSSCCTNAVLSGNGLFAPATLLFGATAQDPDLACGARVSPLAMLAALQKATSRSAITN
jgi:hypothetical protein